MPRRLTRPTVGLRPTSPFTADGTDDAAVGFGADAERGEARRDRGAGARARAAGVAIERVRVLRLAAARAPAGRGVVGAEVRPFAQVRLAQDHRTGLAQPRHEEGILCRTVFRHRERAGRIDQAGDVDVVLDQDRQAVQRATDLAGLAFGVERLGVRERTRIELDHRVELRAPHRRSRRCDPDTPASDRATSACRPPSGFAPRVALSSTTSTRGARCRRRLWRRSARGAQQRRNQHQDRPMSMDHGSPVSPTTCVQPAGGHGRDGRLAGSGKAICIGSGRVACAAFVADVAGPRGEDLPRGRGRRRARPGRAAVVYFFLALFPAILFGLAAGQLLPAAVADRRFVARPRAGRVARGPETHPGPDAAPRERRQRRLAHVWRPGGTLEQFGGTGVDRQRVEPRLRHRGVAAVVEGAPGRAWA